MIHAWYSREAADLYDWAMQEVNRIKATRIYKAAMSLEERYRKHHKAIVDDPYTKPVCMPGRPPKTGSSVQYIRLHGANHPLCIRCNRPVEDLNKIGPGDKPTARIVCKDCTGAGY